MVAGAAPHSSPGRVRFSAGLTARSEGGSLSSDLVIGIRGGALDNDSPAVLPRTPQPVVDGPDTLGSEMNSIILRTKSPDNNALLLKKT